MGGPRRVHGKTRNCISDEMANRNMDNPKSKMKLSTHRYIQFDVSKLGEPENHSGAKVIQPEAVNHVSASNIPTHTGRQGATTSRDPQCASLDGGAVGRGEMK